MQGDVDTARRLLRVAESGKQLFMFVLTAMYVYHIIDTILGRLVGTVQMGTVQIGTVQVMQVLTYLH